MLTQKQELFTQNLFSGMTQRGSWIKAGYSNKYEMAIIDTNASMLANSNKVKMRLKELNAPIIDIIQSKKEAKLKILEKIYKQDPQPETITAHAVIGAISEHNKMEHIYDDVTFQDNRVLIINVESKEAKELTENVSRRLLDLTESKSEPLIEGTNDNV